MTKKERDCRKDGEVGPKYQLVPNMIASSGCLPSCPTVRRRAAGGRAGQPIDSTLCRILAGVVQVLAVIPVSR